MKSTIVIGLLLSFVSTSLAQTNALTLADARRIAFERNWDLLAARSGIDSATAQLIATTEFPNPAVLLSTAKIGTHDGATSLGNGVWERNYDTIAAVSQLIEVGGKRRNRQVSAREGVAGAEARFYDAKRSLDQGVTKAYVAALLARDNTRILNESAGYLLREARIAAARFKAGDISESDQRQIEINAGQFELQARAAESAAVQARIAVEVLMGVHQPGGNWTPVESFDQLANASPPHAIAAKPEAARPDVLAAEADLRKSEADLRLQKAMRIPDPTIVIQGEHEPPGGGPAVDTFGFGVSFPIPLWNRNCGNIRAAKATRDQAEIALERVKAEVASDIASAELTYQEALGRWERYRVQISPKAAKVRESVAFAYENGGASLVDLLEAERTDNDVRLATAQAIADTAKAAADLIAARNVLSETKLTMRK